MVCDFFGFFTRKQLIFIHSANINTYLDKYCIFMLTNFDTIPKITEVREHKTTFPKNVKLYRDVQN